MHGLTAEHVRPGVLLKRLHHRCGARISSNPSGCFDQSAASFGAPPQNDQPGNAVDSCWDL